jgi:alkanesulfonate monooxygenase SsuD/methylene tetrahydromethanopterin reductase-like flavin-dependent oxidoreductase (luciferase family)
MRSLWAGPGEFHGEFYDHPPVVMEPGPAQSPEPPILLGGAADPALRRAGRLAAGWVSASRADPRTLGRSIQIVKDAAEEAGRDPSALRFVCRAAVRVRPAGRADRRLLHGSPEEIRADFDDIAAQGMTELFVDLNFDPDLTGPEADPKESMLRAEEALHAFAPGN